MARLLSADRTRALGGRGVVTALIGIVAGPSSVWLYESGQIDLFRAMPLLNIWLVVLVAVTGLCSGVAVFRRGRVWLGGVSLPVNTAVLGLYGFLATFFSLGGSR